MLSPLRSLALVWLVPLFLATNGAGATTFLAEGYAIRVWQTEDGLPQNLVTSAIQTRDGYLWFGTHSGLARFDGDRFQIHNSTNMPSLQDRRVARLFEDAQGTLWIGHEAGAITRYRDGRFEPFGRGPHIENERIIGLGSDQQGGLWAMRENGAIDSLENGTRLPSLIAPALPAIMTWSYHATGGICVTENGKAARLLDGKLVPFELHPAPADGMVAGIAATADGGAWVLCDNRIRKWKDGLWTEDRGAYAWATDTISNCLELRDGTLAVGTIHFGLYLIFSDGRLPAHFDRSNGLPQDWVRFLYEDREGTLWAGVGSAGLASIHPSAFSILDSPDQRQGCTVTSVAPGRDGGLWIGTDGAGLYHQLNGAWTLYDYSKGLENAYVQSVTESPDGHVWAGNFWWGGPYRLEKGRFIRPKNVDPTWSPALALVPGTKPGEMLVGNRDGLLKLSEDSATWLAKSPMGTADDVSAVVIDRDGNIWCGFTRGGLARVHDGKTSFFNRRDGLASDGVQCLFPDEDGTLWIGTADNGLTRLKAGKFVNLGPAHGLADSSICYIMDDGRGYFWLSTRHGLQRIAKDELNRCADGAAPTLSSLVYDRNDGLPIVEFTGGRQGAGCQTPDGRLWFASSKGVVTVDPSRIRPNPTPPPVVIEAVLVDGKEMPLVEGRLPGQLRPDHQRLEFRYSGLSFVAPDKVLFKYRLEGIDRDWIDAGAKRTAFYSRLPAGTYHFRVIACNNDAVWNAKGSLLTFTVAPFFWQTWWFTGAVILAIAGAVAWLARFVTRRRMQRQIEQMEHQHGIERERARIAQDIHDDVGASLSRIAMLSQPAHRDLVEPERTAAMLSRIYTTAREVTRSLDEIVWAVDPRHDTLDSLVDYMGRFAQDFLTAANVRCRLDLPVQVPAWPLTAETRHNLFLAFKESLNNAVKHATATEVRISLGLGADSFSLVVKDNGHGFNPALKMPAEPGRPGSGNGLANMKTRLARIGGRCEIASEPGTGTSVSLIVVFAGLGRSRPPFPPSRSQPVI